MDARKCTQSAVKVAPLNSKKCNQYVLKSTVRVDSLSATMSFAKKCTQSVVIARKVRLLARKYYLNASAITVASLSAFIDVK